MNTKHTPAPWVIENANNHTFDDSINITTRSGFSICKVRYTPKDIEDIKEYEENAKIISLSPIMYTYIIKKSNQGCEYAKNILSLIS